MEGKAFSDKTTGTSWEILIALSVAHLLNDTLQSLLPAIYPVLKETHGLSFAQIGMITFVFQLTASLLQPFVGAYTDRRPKPFLLAAGMGMTLIGLVFLSRAETYPALLLASGLVGTGSSIFHPESSRLARLASGGRHGLAQSLFQVGGNLGSSLGPLAAAWVVVPRGQGSIGWFSILAVAGIAVLAQVGRWYAAHLGDLARSRARPAVAQALPRGVIARSIAVLLVLIFSKYFYLASLTNYYTFFLISKFGVSVQHSQVFLFLFLFAVALGTIIGGPMGDRFGRKPVIWFSILGVAPFSLLLPHAGLAGTAVLSMCAGVILASAMSAILVYAQDLLPGRVGLVAGLFFGFGFGMAGLGSALLGALADRTSVEYVFRVCAYLPLMGILAAALPRMDRN